MLEFRSPSQGQTYSEKTAADIAVLMYEGSDHLFTLAHGGCRRFGSTAALLGKDNRR